MISAPYAIKTERLTIRCYEPTLADATMLKEAVDESVEHLLPWLPWAHKEPQTLDEKIALLRFFRGEFDLDRNYVYAIFDNEETRLLGGTGLHPRVGNGGTEIGYWVRAGEKNRGIVTEATAALVKVAFTLLEGIDRVEIHCDPENHASAAIPAKLGFVHEATLRRRPAPGEGRLRDLMIWTLFRESFRMSAAYVAEIAMFDVAGRQLS